MRQVFKMKASLNTDSDPLCPDPTSRCIMAKTWPWLVFLRIGDFDRDSNHDADCDIGDLGQTNGDNKDDGDDDQNSEQSVKKESLVLVPL